MPQDELVLNQYSLDPSTQPDRPCLLLRSTETSEPVEFTFEAIRPGLFRTTFSSKTHPKPPFPSARRPTLDLASFDVFDKYDTTMCFRSSGVEARVDWKSEPIVSIGFTGEEPLHEDLKFRSYALDGPGIAHYTNVGSEMDGMWGYFKVYRQDFGGLEEYTMIGRTLQDVVTLYAELVGYPQLVPRWAFGYLAGGMRYSMMDSPRASEALMEFAEKLTKYDIPCSGFQVSSGYTMSEEEPRSRNVFTWNKHRFPDPKGFCDEYHRRGIRLIANIKPYVLANHPNYDNLAKEGAFFTDPRTGKTGVARLWSAGGGTSGEGGHIDFTSKAGYNFWYNGVKELRKVGMDCMWNDNNEYLLPSDNWQLALESSATTEGTIPDTDPDRRDTGLWGRALHTELMGKSSHDALLEVVPHERPFDQLRDRRHDALRQFHLVRRQRHELGRHAGRQRALTERGNEPTAMLRPRYWRFRRPATRSRTAAPVEPWMYPEIIPELRKAILRRYTMIPYLYSLMLQSTRTAIPPQRWTGWGYEHHPEVWSSQLLKDGETQYWLGDTLLIGGVYEPGVNEAKVYLPKKGSADPGFLNTNTPYQHLPAGAWHTIASPWKGSIPVIARIGCLVPVGKDHQVVAPGDKTNEANLPADDVRGVEIFPTPGDMSDGRTWYSSTWLEDDGISPPPVKVAQFTFSYMASATEVSIRFQKDIRAFEPPWVAGSLTVILPVGDGRVVVSGYGDAIEARGQDEGGRRRFHIVAADQ
ncbi:hypothetical protein LTS16_014885 [Friedmanniomyces endolithicus]|nr:hypothetical protein LTS16_014885 [Friedmanniomyces endolithicus]